MLYSGPILSALKLYSYIYPDLWDYAVVWKPVSNTFKSHVSPVIYLIQRLSTETCTLHLQVSLS